MKALKQIKQLRDAYVRLLEAIKIPVDAPLVVDGTIQRFEFCFELSWKAIKTILEAEGTLCTSPKSSLQEAFQADIITNEDGWLALLKARNMTSHVYDQSMADEIYAMIKAQHALIGELIIALEKKVGIS